MLNPNQTDKNPPEEKPPEFMGQSLQFPGSIPNDEAEGTQKKETISYISRAAFLTTLICAPLPFTLSTLSSLINDDVTAPDMLPPQVWGSLIFAGTYFVNFCFGVELLHRYTFTNPQRTFLEGGIELLSGFISTIAPYLAFINNPVKDSDNLNLFFQVAGAIGLLRTTAIYGQQMWPNLVRSYYRYLYNKDHQSSAYRLSSYTTWENEEVVKTKADLIAIERLLQRTLRKAALMLTMQKNTANTISEHFNSQADNLTAVLPALLDATDQLNQLASVQSYTDALNGDNDNLNIDFPKKLDNVMKTLLSSTALYDQRFGTNWTRTFRGVIPSSVAALLFTSVLMVSIVESLESNTISELQGLRSFLTLCIFTPVFVMGFDTLMQISKALQIRDLTGQIAIYPSNTIAQQSSTKSLLGITTAILVVFISLSFGGILSVSDDVVDPDRELSGSWDPYEAFSDFLPAWSKYIWGSTLSSEDSFVATVIQLCAGVPVFNLYGAFFAFLPVLKTTVIHWLENDQLPESIDEASKLVDRIIQAIGTSKSRENHIRNLGRSTFSVNNFVLMEQKASAGLVSRFNTLFGPCKNCNTANEDGHGIKEGLLPPVN
ncbi:MAG: hypothetical protein CL816_07700 [Coxiellaceae bacterium]|nr:hypothetical protein [Coxiellaceae bacterium]